MIGLAEKYPLVMRISLAFVFGWFGISEIINPVYFSGYVPPFITSLPIFNPNLFIQTHGVVLTLLSLCLIFKFHLRLTGILNILMLMQITGSLLLISGFNEIVVRDIGLLGLAISIWLYEIKKYKNN